jgi:hypothetical protein
VPLIALTHAPIMATDGWLVGGLATFTAAITCLPLAYLWERGGRTTWAPAVLHGLIGTWQLFERTYPPTFSVVVLCASITVPLLVLLDRIPARRRPPAGMAHGRAPSDSLDPAAAVSTENRRTS